MNKSAEVYEILKHGEPVPLEEAKAQFDGSSNYFWSSVQCLERRDYVDVVRLNADMQPIQGSQGSRVHAVRLETDRPLQFYTEPDKQSDWRELYPDMAQNKTEAVFRYLVEHGPLVDYHAMFRLFNDANSKLATFLSHLTTGHDIELTRLDHKKEPVDEGLHPAKKFVETCYLQVEMDRPAEEYSFRSTKGRSTRKIKGTYKQDVPGYSLDELLALMRGGNRGYIAPCGMDLKEHRICYHGEKCASSYECPIAERIPWYNTYQDRRVWARHSIEKRGFRKGWVFSIRTKLGEHSPATTEQTEA